MAENIDVMMRLIDGVTEPLRRIRSQMEQTANFNRRMGREIQNVGRTFSSMGHAMLPVAAGIVGAAGLGAKAFVDFDATITAAGAKAGATAQQIDELRKFGAKLGADFPVSAAEAAEGIDRLAAAGYDTNQIMGAMPAILTASVASGEDLATTSDVVSNALNIWNLRAGDVAANATHVSDVIQMAANQSSLGMQDFGVAMQYAGAPAAALHISIEELSTAMAIMKNNGIEASTIGTSLRSTFSRLAAPPKAAAEAIQELGLQVKDSQGNFVGLQPVIDQMREKMQGLSDTQQIALAKAIAGEDAYSGLLSLIKTSPQAYQAMSDAISNSAGSSKEQYEVMQKTMKVTIDNMKGSFETLAITMGTLLTPQINSVANALGSLADWLNNLDDSTKIMIADFAASIVGFTAFSLGMGKIISIGGKLVSTYGELGKALKNPEKGTKTLNIAVRNLQSGFNFVRNGASTLATAVVSNFTTIKNLKWASIANQIKSIVPDKTAISAGFSAIRASAASAGAAALNAAKNFSVMNILSGMGGALKGTVSILGGVAKGIFGVARAGLALAISPIGIAIIAIAGAAYLLYKNWNTVGPIFINMWTRIKGAVYTAWAAIQPALAALGRAISPLVNVVKGLFSSIMQGNGIFGVLATVLRTIAMILGGMLLGQIIVVASVISGALVGAIRVATAIVTAFIGVLHGIITFLTGVFTGNWQMAWQGVSEIFSSIFNGIKGVAEGVLEGIKAAINGVIDGINGINVDIPDWVPKFGGQHFALNIPHLYKGTDNWQGGAAMVHDKGAEIIDLPSGSRVIPHEESMRKEYERGKATSSAGGKTIYLPKLADKIVVGNENDVHVFMQKFLQEIEKAGINMAEGAI